MSRSEKPLWKCPKCGHEFVTENLWHACGRYSLADHFEDSDPKVRELFDRFTAMVEACGPVTIYAEQTRIVCQVRVRFAGVVPRRRDLDIGVWLTRPVQHARLRRTELIPPSTFVHHFRFKRPAELDDAFMAIVREGYAVGRQHHLERGAPPKPRRRQRKSGQGKRVKEGETPQPERSAARQEPAETGTPAETRETPPREKAAAKRHPAKRGKRARHGEKPQREKPTAGKEPAKKRAPRKGKRATGKSAPKAEPTPPQETGDAS